MANDEFIAGANGDDIGLIVGNVGADSASGNGAFGVDNTAPTKRRGRPRKDGSVGGGSSNGGTGKPARSQKETLQSSINNLADTLKLVHMGIAGATKLPELELDDDDATRLSKAITSLLDEYEIKPNPKMQAAIGVIVASGMVYGPKIALIKMRISEEKEQKKGGNLINLPQA